MELLKSDELAAALKVSVPAVKLWRTQGMPFVPVGRLRRYILADVLAWLRRREEERVGHRARRRVRKARKERATRSCTRG